MGGGGVAKVSEILFLQKILIYKKKFFPFFLWGWGVGYGGGRGCLCK